MVTLYWQALCFSIKASSQNKLSIILASSTRNAIIWPHLTWMKFVPVWWCANVIRMFGNLICGHVILPSSPFSKDPVLHSSHGVARRRVQGGVLTSRLLSFSGPGVLVSDPGGSFGPFLTVLLFNGSFVPLWNSAYRFFILFPSQLNEHQTILVMPTGAAF